MTQYCTSRDHALLVAKYFLSIRRRVTHVVKFSTTPYGLNLAPGNFIKIFTEASPYSAANNGVVDSNGIITSATNLNDGKYTVIFWTPANSTTQSATMTVASGKVVETALWNSVFTISNSTISSNVYMVEQLTLSQDGLVEIVATEFPCDTKDVSLIALDLTSGTAFLTDN
jgi:predicted phage tail protein